ncbi:MAG: alpha-L-arabinofuranosidase, partial [Bacteroidales bacterium]|nr:alpha-L-arabinofuranosidase [Bacteroidales bacterium]
RQTSNEQVTVAQLDGFSADTYTLEVKARKTGGMEGFFIYYGLDESGRNGYAVNIGGWNNRTTAVQPMRRGRVNDVLGRRARQTIEEGRWYDVKIVVAPEAATLYVDGEEMTVAKPTTQTRHFCQTGYDTQTGELIIKVVNGTDQPYRRSFEIAGASTVAAQGKVFTLAGNALEENSFEEPRKIAPVATSFNNFGKQFTYDFAPSSFTIMRVKVQ